MLNMTFFSAETVYCLLQSLCCIIMQGRIHGETIGAIARLKPTKVYFIYHDFVQFGKQYSQFNLENVSVIRLDYQILLKSPPLTLRAGSAPVITHIFLNDLVLKLRFSQVDLANSCNINAPTATFTHKAPSLNFMNVAIRNVEAHPGLKWQFFGSDTGVFTRYPAAPISRCNTTYDNRFRPWYDMYLALRT